MTPVQFFKCLSDETRLRCMMLLHREGKLCVCELTHALDLSQPKISRHLAQLRHGGLLADKREGQWVYYQLNRELPRWAREMLNTVITATEHEERYWQDYERLQSMNARSKEARCAV
jgi:ArsR family transcriptional regulator, arsenate/arsenite/antimonite-responsive transcriptional repressor